MKSIVLFFAFYFLCTVSAFSEVVFVNQTNNIIYLKFCLDHNHLCQQSESIPPQKETSRPWNVFSLEKPMFLTVYDKKTQSLLGTLSAETNDKGTHGRVKLQSTESGLVVVGCNGGQLQEKCHVYLAQSPGHLK